MKALAWAMNQAVKSFGRLLVQHGPQALLTGVAIEPSGTCNLKCKMCPATKRHKKNRFMSPDLFCRVIDELGTYKHPVRVGLGFGGEPLLHPEFDAMLRYACMFKNLDVNVVTNGLLLETHLELFKNRKVTLYVSMDHMTTKAIPYVTYLLKNKGPNLRMFINLVKGQHPKGTVKYWRKAGATVNLNPLIENYQIASFAKTPQFTNSFCDWPFHYLAVLWNGDLTMCCHDIQAKNIVGHLCAEYTLRDFWLSPFFKSLRLDCLAMDKPALPGCMGCTVWKHSNLYTLTVAK